MFFSPHEICYFLTRFAYFQQQDEEATDPAEARVFTNVITGLHRNYPKDKLEEISTSFCFICLLHLANEQGLKLETGTEEHDAADEKRVGNIWDLKVRSSESSTRISTHRSMFRFIEIQRLRLLHSLASSLPFLSTHRIFLSCLMIFTPIRSLLPQSLSPLLLLPALRIRIGYELNMLYFLKYRYHEFHTALTLIS